MAGERLCATGELAEMEARGFVGTVDGMQRNIFAVKQAGRFHVYLNSCPHTHALIDHIEGQFFSPDRQFLRCGMHGALFRIDDGHCVDGPCEDDALRRLVCEVRDDALYLTEAGAATDGARESAKYSE